MVDVKMKFSSMEKMEAEFKAAAKQIGDSMREMKKIIWGNSLGMIESFARMIM